MSRRHLTAVELIEYADGGMSQTAAYAVEEHLRECDLCAASLAASRRTALSISRLDTLPAPADIRDRVRARLAPDLAISVTCRQALPLLQECVDRCLPPIPAMQLQGHLGSCAACRCELAALESMTGLVRSLPIAASPAEVRERVIAAARTRVVRWAPKLRPALAAAGLAALGLFALLARPSMQPLQQKPTSMVAANPGAGATPVSPSLKAVEAPAPVEMAQAQPAGSESRLEGEPLVRAYVPSVRPVRQVSAKRSLRPVAPRVALALADAASASPLPLVARRTSSPVPAAMQVLRRVAQTADYSAEAQRAMIQAAESISVLSSEDNLDRVPEFATAAPGAGERPASAPTVPMPADKQPGRNSVSAPDEPIAVSADSLA